MKLNILILTGAMLPFSAFSSDTNQFNYFELSKVDIPLDAPSEDLKGFGLDAKWSLNDTIYLSGIYQQYDNSTSDINRKIIGIGALTEINKYVIPFGQIDYIHLTSKSFNSKATMNQWRLSAGISGALNHIGYKIGFSRYFVNENNVSDATVMLAEIFYSINNKFSIGVEAELGEDNTDIYSVAGRYHF